MPYSLRKAVDILASQFPSHERAVLDAGSSHDGDCRCDLCREWWALVGPEEDSDGTPSFGPFTASEIGAMAETEETK
jgi:hypothetical protein